MRKSQPRLSRCESGPEQLRSRARLPSRRASLRLYSAALPLLLLAEMQPTSLSDFVRMGVVRGAKTADALDSIWQQFSGEVTPTWAKPQELPALPAPIDEALALELLELPLKLAAESTGLSYAALSKRLLTARKQAMLLYPGRYPRAPDPAREDGDAVYAFDLDAFAVWRILQDVLPVEMRRRYAEQLGDELLAGPFATATSKTIPPFETTSHVSAGWPHLQPALDDIKAFLQYLEQVKETPYDANQSNTDSIPPSQSTPFPATAGHADATQASCSHR